MIPRAAFIALVAYTLISTPISAAEFKRDNDITLSELVQSGFSIVTTFTSDDRFLVLQDGPKLAFCTFTNTLDAAATDYCLVNFNL